MTRTPRWPVGAGPGAAQSCVVSVFARAPVPGRVKTRLIPALGPSGAALLHERMVRLALHAAVAAGRGPVRLWCEPTVDHPLFAELARDLDVDLAAQSGPDLGERMRRALGEGVRTAGATVLIGSDCPFLDATRIRWSADRLRTHDAVLGPARDGGYVLIGVRRAPPPSLFRGIRWGGPTVLAETRRRLKRLGWRWAELGVLPDIDRPRDLVRLPPALGRPARTGV